MGGVHDGANDHQPTTLQVVTPHTRSYDEPIAVSRDDRVSVG